MRVRKGRLRVKIEEERYSPKLAFSLRSPISEEKLRLAGLSNFRRRRGGFVPFVVVVVLVKENKKVRFVHTRIGAFTACHQDDKAFYSPERNPSRLILTRDQLNIRIWWLPFRVPIQTPLTSRARWIGDAIMDRCQILNVVNDIA